MMLACGSWRPPLAGPTAGQKAKCEIVFCGGPDGQSKELNPHHGATAKQ